MMMSDSPYNYVRLYNDQDDKTESKIDATTTTTATTATTITENTELQQSSKTTMCSKNEWRLCNDEIISGVELAQRVTQDSREETEEEDETPKLGICYESSRNEISRYPFCNNDRHRQQQQNNSKQEDAGNLILHRTLQAGLTLDEKQWLAIGFLSLTILILVVVFFLI